MSKEKHMNIWKRLFILCFTISVSIAVLPAGIINTYGMFGDVQARTVIHESQEETEELVAKAIYKQQHSKGINVYNVWLYLLICIIVIAYTIYCYRLPRGDTIITFKIRMNN